MSLATYVGLLHTAEDTLAQSLRQVADGHPAEVDIYYINHTLARECDQHVKALQPVVDRYGEDEQQSEPERLHAQGLSQTRTGPVGLLRDLHDLYMLAAFVDMTWTVVGQAGRAARDRELVKIVESCHTQTSTQLAWIRTRMNQAAPQALVS